MLTQATPLSLTEFTKVLGSLTPAQQSLFGQIGRHSEPVTVPMLAAELGLHVSSVRETLEALIKAEVVTAERMPTKGRGRPATGYSTILPPHPMFGALTLNHFSRAVFTWLETLGLENGTQAARQIGANWADESIEHMEVECLDEAEHLPDTFDYDRFLKETRTYLRRVGLGATRRQEDGQHKSLVLLTAPVLEPTNPNHFALEARLGWVERFLTRRFGNFFENTIDVDPENPLNLILTIHSAAADIPNA